MPKTNIWTERYCYFIVFLLIYLEWGYAPVIAQNISGTAKTAFMIISVLPLFFFESFKFKTNSTILFGYLATIITLSAIRDVDIRNSILLIVPIFCAFILTSAYSAEKIIKAFCNIMTFLAVYSLVVYIIAWIIPLIILSFPVLPNSYNIPIHNLGLAVIPTEVSIIRNYGIAWEPGAFALLLCLAVFGQIVGYNSLNKYKIIINILTIITTLSTMGIIVLASIILITRCKTEAVSSSKSFTILLLLFFGISIFFLLDNSTKMYELLFDKLSGFSFKEENAETTQARVNAIIYPGMAFLSSPVSGIGYDSFKYINENLCNSVATNTIINWFAIVGIFLGLPCTFYYFNAVLKASAYLCLNPVFKIVLVMTFILLVSTESLLRISLIYVIIFYGCSQKRLIKHA